jgi:protein-disulfide isomerase
MPPMPAKSRKNIEPVIEPVEEDEDFEFLEEAYSPVDEEEDTITFKRSHFYAALSVLTFFFGLVLGAILTNMGLLQWLGLSPRAASQASGSVLEAPATAEPQYVRYDVPTEGHYSRGPSDAPITIVEFSDYQCPFCRRWHDEVSQELFAAYPGQIRLVYRNLPLTSIHPDAFSAAEAALCAGEQNAYWDYHDKLFGGELLGTGVYLQYAQDLNLDMTSFESCLNDRTYQADIESDSDFAINLGVRSTPTFFVNGLAIVGAQPLDVFKQVIDKELAGEIPAQ